MKNNERINLPFIYGMRIYIALFILTFLHLEVSAQTTLDTTQSGCKTDPVINSLLAQTCSSASIAYINTYSKQSFYIPNTNPLTPSPLITLKITFHVINKSNGTGSFPGTPQGVNDLNQVALYIKNWNERYSVPRNANYVVPGFVSNNISDSRINYELTNIYFYNDDNLNLAAIGSTYTDNDIFTYINGIDPTRLTEGLPIIFNNGYYVGAAGYANIGSSPYVHTFLVSPPHGLWFVQEHLRHEIGHCFGLHHTYNSETLSCTTSDYLSDVFPVNNTNCPSSSSPCFNCYENAPLMKSNNLMSGEAGNNWISPLQMGRMRRNFHLGPMRQFAKEMTSDFTTPWTITGNEVWDFDIQMYEDIIVKAGKTLTIKCKVGMANGGRIIVERNAKLIIDGGEIYAWGNNWAGVQVWGNSTKRQTIVGGLSPDHGIVQIINQGTIKDASNAITTGKYDENGNLDWGGYFGGIVQCNNAKFINNIRAIQYLSYQNFHPVTGNIVDNIGYVYNSLFETNAILKDPLSPEPQVFISMWNVQGVKYYGNTYQNIRSPLPAIDKRGYGIHSVDASYYVDRYKVCSVFNTTTGQCVSYSTNNASTFKNVQYGILVQNATPFTNIQINDNDFIGCNRSIYFGGSYNTKVTNNRIDVGLGTPNVNLMPYGIYSDNSSAYAISNNTVFSTSYTTYGTSLATGICVNGSNGVTNVIYRNTINLMGSGSTVYGNNQGPNNLSSLNSAGQGLQFICNNYGQGTIGKNYSDLYMGQLSFINGRIDKVQGSPSAFKGANNFFSHTGNVNPLAKSDYWDGAGVGTSNLPGDVKYYYNSGNSLLQPFFFDNPMTPLGLIAAYNANLCPVTQTTSSGGSGGASSAKIVIAANTASISALLAQIDGGQTQTLLNLISSNVSPGNLKNTLESKILSDEVLIAYVNRANTPPGHIKDIHDKNKPVNYSVWQAILNRNLPNGIMNGLNEQQSVTTISKLNLIYGQVSDLYHEKAFVVDQTISRMLSDSIQGWNKDSIVDLMKADNRDDASCRLLAAYVALDKFADATSLISDIKIEHGGTLDDFCKLQELIIQLRQQVKSNFELKTDAASLALVQQIEANNDNGTTNAQALLRQVFNYKYYEFIDLPFTSSSSSRLFNANEATNKFEEVLSAFKLFPNPSNGNTYFVYNNSGMKDQSIEVLVYDVTGKIVLTQSINNNNTVYTLNTESFASGLYLVTLVADGKLIDKQKLIKQ